MVQIDFTKRKEMYALMDRADEFPDMIFGINEGGEHVVCSINKDSITCETCQANGWFRTNILYKNGVTEEFFEK